MYNIEFIRNREETNEKFACKCSNSPRYFLLFYTTLMEHRDTFARHWNINDMYSYSTLYTQGNLEQIFIDDALLSLHGGTVTTKHSINIQELLKSVPFRVLRENLAADFYTTGPNGLYVEQQIILSFEDLLSCGYLKTFQKKLMKK